ncbi:hypothetical protein I6J17_07920 [Heyndrickxia coagulans]|uniref:Gp58-like protein n=4 Tax=Heyndrickxia coagulans TaxID=1398 RepID=A0A0B5WRS8_HEYCO|nr:hypothetical protein [Heyndrickxia coagulans]AJH77257.1 gp58-like family protein [Heyndrickxia coagulans DSM 1 = ATCC 7050]AJH78650.1 gp58-like family protein [Heyndrickxia coagulans DSM 1 = ATCC 7050]MCR2847793.1 hypothetical protein [Heyndrickxia coagulans]MDR4225256.1 hypothetical protein [Heyndrickxia coagulans DSM 1 = ATCC 7050]QQS93790.1 hypothetical protein I6J17_07920 [Heyndrickxia coagulans]
MTIMGSVDISFTNSTQIAKGAEQTAGSAQQTANTAQETANGAAQTAGQAQETAEAATQTATQAAEAAADAAQAAQTAITTANGKNKAYYGATTPTSPKSGDIWFVEDSSGNVTAIKHYDGTQWVTDVDNTALAQQISAAQAAADNAVTVGQAAQQTAADAEAKGDAAAKTAEEAKDAATKAQADAASAVTSANNAVDTANKATQDAQDAIDKAQDGFDAAQDALSKAGAAVDTANTAKQVASDAATQANTAKTNAQTAMSNAQDAISQAKAANDNANTREKSIIKSNTAPSDPATDQLWIDTSKTPQIMRRWTGSTWVDLSPTQASQIGAVSTTTYTTDITNINNTLSQKASATTVNTLTGRVDKAETAISQNASDIALKADKSYVDTIKNTVDNHSTLISQNADAIALKASQSTVDALTGRVSTAEATLKTQADQISARITKTDADAKYATQTALTATANSLTSNITAVQTNLDNLSVGGRNYVLNSTLDNVSNWFFKNGVTVDSSMLYNGHKTLKFSASDLSSDTWLFAKPPLRNAKAGEIYSAGAWFNLKSNTMASDDGAYLVIEFYDSSKTRIAYWNIRADNTVLDKWQYVKSENRTAPTNTAYVTVTSFSKRNGTFWVADMTLNKGTKVSDWSPAPEDMATQSQISQLSDDINLRVQKNDVITQINLSTESILIAGNKVHITGQTTIDNAVIKDAMIASMTANKLTAGTIDANVITVKNINASNITAGTLSADRIAARSIDASKLATGTITAASGVIGSLDASKITTGTLDAAKINVVNLTADSIKSGTLTSININGGNINIGGGKFTVDSNGLMSATNATVTGSFSSSAKDDQGTWDASLSSGRIAMSKIGDASETGGQYVPIYEANISAGGIYTVMRRNSRPWNYVQMSAGAVGSNDTFISVTANEGDSSALYPEKLVVGNRTIVGTDGLHLDDDIVIGSGGWRALKFQTIRYNSTDYPAITQKDGKAGILFGSGYMYLLCSNKVVNLAQVYWPTKIDSSGKVVTWVNPLK